MDFYSIVCGAAALLWLAVASGKAGNITPCNAVVFATFYDGWELDDYPQAEDVAVKWWRPMVESPEGVSGGMEHE